MTVAPPPNCTKKHIKKKEKEVELKLPLLPLYWQW